MWFDYETDKLNELFKMIDDKLVKERDPKGALMCLESLRVPDHGLPVYYRLRRLAIIGTCHLAWKEWSLAESTFLLAQQQWTAWVNQNPSPTMGAGERSAVDAVRSRVKRLLDVAQRGE
jgi:hypothetical protein